MQEKETIVVECAICGSPVEVERELLNIEGATFVCSLACLDGETMKERLQK